MQSKKKYNINTTVLSALFIAFTIIGCKKFITVDPPSTSVTGGSTYTSNLTAAAVLTGLYDNLSGAGTNGINGLSSISRQGGLSADEFTLWNGITTVGQIAYYKNSLSVNQGTGSYPGSEFWSTIYPYIYICNSAIEGLTASSTLTPAVKQQLLGESKFMRAMFYFYLTNLYGDVPLALSSDYIVNSTLPRTAQLRVYQQIIADLKDAQSLLADSYLKADALTLYTAATAERVRPNKAAATALLARAYLYTGDYPNAEAQATTVINNTAYYNLVALNSVFLKNSQEAIWQLQPVTTSPTVNTQDGYQFIIPSTGPNSTNMVYLSNSLLNSFEAGDLRAKPKNWIDTVRVPANTGTLYYYPYKYKNNATSGSPTEYLMMLRLGEQYLIRAEARSQQNNFSGAIADLNAIRTRAGLASTTSSNQATLLAAIQHERQVELFTEMGHRWLDIKRTGTVDAVMTIATAAKGGIWQSYQQLYPIYFLDIQRDQNLVQNIGY